MALVTISRNGEKKKQIKVSNAIKLYTVAYETTYMLGRSSCCILELYIFGLVG